MEIQLIACVFLIRWFSSNLAVLVQLAAEGHSQVSCSSRNSVSSKQGFPTVKATVPSFADIHVLETRLHTTKIYDMRTNLKHTSSNEPVLEVHMSSKGRTVSCEGSSPGGSWSQTDAPGSLWA